MYLIAVLILALGCADAPLSPPVPAGKVASSIAVAADLTATVSQSKRGVWLTADGIDVDVAGDLTISRIEWYLYNDSGRIQLRKSSGSFTDHWNKGDGLVLTIAVGDDAVTFSPLATKGWFSNWGITDEVDQSILDDIETGDSFTLLIQSASSSTVAVPDDDDHAPQPQQTPNTEPQCQMSDTPQFTFTKQHLRITEGQAIRFNIGFNVSGSTNCNKKIVVAQVGPTEDQQPGWIHRLRFSGTGFSAKDGGRYVEHSFRGTSDKKRELSFFAVNDEDYGSGRNGNPEYDDYANDDTILTFELLVYLGSETGWLSVHKKTVNVTIVDADRPLDCYVTARENAVDSACMTVGNSGSKYGFEASNFGTLPENVLTIDGTDYTIVGIWLDINATTGREHLYAEFDKELPDVTDDYAMQFNNTLVAMNGEGITHSRNGNNHRYYYQYSFLGWDTGQKVRVAIGPRPGTSGNPGVYISFRSSD